MSSGEQARKVAQSVTSAAYRRLSSGRNLTFAKELIPSERLTAKSRPNASRTKMFLRDWRSAKSPARRLALREMKLG